MRNNTFYEALEMIDDKYITEAHSDTTRRTKTKGALWWEVAAACVIIALTFAIILAGKNDAPHAGDNAKDTKVVTDFREDSDEQSAEIESAEDTPAWKNEDVIWGGDVFDYGKEKLALADTVLTPISTVSIGEHFTIICDRHNKLNNLIVSADDDDLIAFAIQSTIDSIPERIRDLYKTAATANKELMDVFNQCREELMNSHGISYNEAYKRAFTHAEYLAKREEVIKLFIEAEVAHRELLYDKSIVDALVEYGFTLLYDCNDPKYSHYLMANDQMGVFVGTKKQILELKNAKFDFDKLWLYHVFEKADQYTYGGGEAYLYSKLSDGSKLTNGLIDEYNGNNGEALEVKVVFSNIGCPKYSTDEIWRLAAEKAGLPHLYPLFSRDEEQKLPDDHPDVTVENIQKIRSIYHDIMYNAEHHKNVCNALLKEGELLNIEDFSSTFTAVLTYDRAMEIASCGDIAYIYIGEDDYHYYTGVPELYLYSG